MVNFFLIFSLFRQCGRQKFFPVNDLYLGFLNDKIEAKAKANFFFFITGIIFNHCFMPM